MTAWSLRPWRVMEREQASCSIWPHGRTQKVKANTEENASQCRTCAVCINPPFYYRALTLTYFSYHKPTYTHRVTGWVFGMPWHSEEDNEMSANFSGVMD